ncbi:MAG TPA: hypothetical protein VI603_02265 [Saprospiraceae bacterium]|nr:hypothetical protein [Saprospiraceae bacterium]
MALVGVQLQADIGMLGVRIIINVTSFADHGIADGRTGVFCGRQVKCDTTQFIHCGTAGLYRKGK